MWKCVCIEKMLGVAVSRCIVEGFMLQCPFFSCAQIYTPHIIFEIHLCVCVCVNLYLYVQYRGTVSISTGQEIYTYSSPPYVVY